MLFGTNTTFGIKAGSSTGQVPEVTVGYDRQEAVILPLVANVSAAADAQGNRLLEPCDLTKKLEVSGGRASGYLVHPCSLVAYKAGSLDSYSVLASFGAKFSAEADKVPKASGGLAQYFATGMAAQILAATGGAAVVSTGEAAVQSAEKTTPLAALFPDGTAFARARATAFDNSIETLRAHIKAATGPGVLAKKVAGFLAALGSSYPLEMTSKCTAIAECETAMDADAALLWEAPKLSAAVAAWDSY
jgi:hypothetical protein